MPKNFSRSQRVADAVHQCVARVIREDFKDPRVGMITVLNVKMTPDLKQAKIYVSVLEDQKISETLVLLNKAAGFFRSQIANAIQLRVVPNLHFIFDDSIIRGNRMERILESGRLLRPASTDIGIPNVVKNNILHKNNVNDLEIS